MTFMELYELVYFNITNTISVCHQERFVTNIFLNTLDTTTCHCIITSIHNCYLPRFHISLVYCHLIFTITIIKSHIRIM